jgi:uncharacterized membrane protein YhdT
MNNISDIMKGGVSAILIAVGYVVLWCAIICLIGGATGMADNPEEILWCGWSCLVMGAIQLISGIIWYYIVKPKA